ncbi:MAG: HAMP domain-containing histidine kinase [Actinobacteria bacterium]|nr:HAMP domain-containing histidine kinase [Actinomycetota bacterium]
MNPLRSVRARLGLALLLVIAGALGIVYLIVVPSLERRLVEAKLHQLEKAAPVVAQRLEASVRLQWDLVAEEQARAFNARVVVYEVSRRGRTVLRSVASSGEEPLDGDPVAVRSARTLSPARGTVTRGRERFAEAAHPLKRPVVVLLSSSLRDALESVDQVKRRLLLAGLLALSVALVVGLGAASLFARRIRRLERAANRIAGGHFDEPVRDSGSDELAELASAFDRMRLRLAQLDRARGEFIANASHELRTPIFSLSGFLELLAEEDVSAPTRREFLAEMRTQVDRLTRLATDLLDLSRLDAGRLRIDRVPIDLARVARAAAAEFGPLAQTAGKQLELAADGAVVAMGDEQRVLQIVRILVENALRHTPEGTTVLVSAAMADGLVALAVRDDGPGIPPKELANVFDRFYRVEGGIASGSGLGLAIARELAQLMGGTLEVDSEPGRTAFSLRLPPRAATARFHVKTGELVTSERPPG